MNTRIGLGEHDEEDGTEHGEHDRYHSSVFQWTSRSAGCWSERDASSGSPLVNFPKYIIAFLVLIFVLFHFGRPLLNYFILFKRWYLHLIKTPNTQYSVSSEYQYARQYTNACTHFHNIVLMLRVDILLFVFISHTLILKVTSIVPEHGFIFTSWVSDVTQRVIEVTFCTKLACLSMYGVK